MLVAPAKGFVFLAVPKTGTTAIERAFGRFAQGTFQRDPFKHARYDNFQTYVQPFLEAKGYERSSYEVVCVVREPIEWLFSWYRYRSREDLAKPSAKRHRNFSGNVSFDDFVQAYMKRHREGRVTAETRYAKVGRATQFVRPLDGEPAIDRIFRYDHLNLLVDFLCDKVGKTVEIEARNVSPERRYTLSPKVEEDLRAFFEPEYRLYEDAITESIVPPRPPKQRKKRKGKGGLLGRGAG